jgi:hypothetical protein
MLAQPTGASAKHCRHEGAPMRATRHFFVLALSLALAAPAALVLGSAAAFAQDQGGAAEPVKQIVLSDKQIEAVLAAQKDIAAIMAKAPQAEPDQIDPKTMAQLEAVAKKYKFANYAEFELVSENIGLVMDGVDPQSKKYVGADVMLKRQIADLQADKKMAPKDKKEALDQMNAQLKEIAPIQNPGNIDLVLKYYDKLSAAMPQNE